jgi:hypothetical protein
MPSGSPALTTVSVICLEASVLLNMFNRGTPCYCLRVFWVIFSKADQWEGEKPALYSTVVDIVNHEVSVA